METVLRCLCANNPVSWSSQLPWAEYAINSRTSGASKMLPFECCLGYQPPLFPSQEEEVGVPSAQAFVRRCKRTWRVTRANLIKAVARMKQLTDRRRIPAPTYRVGQRAWLSTKDIPIGGDSRKLAPRYIGPFTIPPLRVISLMAVHPRLPATMRRVHPTIHVSRIKHVVTHPLCPAPEPPPPPHLPVSLTGEKRTRLTELDCRRQGCGLQYLVDWEGYSPEQRSWTPAWFIIDKTLIWVYHRTHPMPTVKMPRDAS